MGGSAAHDEVHGKDGDGVVALRAPVVLRRYKQKNARGVHGHGCLRGEGRSKPPLLLDPVRFKLI